MIVVKVGGSKGIDYAAVCDSIADIIKSGQKMVLVHGGSSSLDEIATALGHPPQFVTSPSGFTSRWTDRKTLEIFQMVYCGQMNKRIVELLQQRSVNAVGLSGMDGAIWRGTRKDTIQVVENGKRKILRGGYTGRVEEVNTKPLRMLLDAGLLPVITPPAISFEGDAINVDGDRGAAATAIALHAETLVILSNVAGVLRDIGDPESRIDCITLDELHSIAEKFVKGRMKIKLLAAEEALTAGVQRVVIGSANSSQCIQKAMEFVGTLIVRDRGGVAARSDATQHVQT